MVELRLGESAGGRDMAGGRLCGPHYFADPPHTLGEGEEEENEEIGREFLVAFGAPVVGFNYLGLANVPRSVSKLLRQLVDHILKQRRINFVQMLDIHTKSDNVFCT